MMVNIHSRLEFNEIHIFLRKSNGFYSNSLASKENILAAEAKKKIIFVVVNLTEGFPNEHISAKIERVLSAKYAEALECQAIYQSNLWKKQFLFDGGV